MLIIISPAKRLDFDTPAPVTDFTQPLYPKQSQTLINTLKKCSDKEIAKMMKLSDSLTQLNVERYKNYKTPLSKHIKSPKLFQVRDGQSFGLSVN